MKARNQNLLSWKDKKGCIIKKLFFRKREAMLECTIKCFLLGGTSGCRFQESNHQFFFRKSDEKKSIKASFYVNKVHPWWVKGIPSFCVSFLSQFL
jgi:hypothetical protein